MISKNYKVYEQHNGEDFRHVKAILRNNELWSSFYDNQTEMIVTKPGRNMFPHVELEFSNLNPKEFYCLYLTIPYLSRHRYRFSNDTKKGWTPAGCDEDMLDRGVYLHPDSPNTGEFWMKEMVTFMKVKITNCAYPPPDNNQQIILSTMHKYRPEIVMIKTRNPADYHRPACNFFKMFSFEVTEFIAVTAYQNPAVKALKIQNNKFAKGFRDIGKRRRNQSDGTSEAQEQDEYLVVDDDVAEASNKQAEEVIPEPVKASITPKRARLENHSEKSRVPVPLISNSSFSSDYYSSNQEAFDTARTWGSRPFIITPTPPPSLACYMPAYLYDLYCNPFYFRSPALVHPYHPSLVHPPVQMDTSPSEIAKKPVQVNEDIVRPRFTNFSVSAILSREG